MKFISHGLRETLTIAKTFARALPPGSLIVARGDLGAGKTAFAKGVAAGLGISEVVNSPTFNIVKVYRNTRLGAAHLNFYHIDAYRLEDPSAVREIGLDDLIGDPSGVCFVEWGQYIADYISAVKENVFQVELSYVSDRSRAIRIERIR